MTTKRSEPAREDDNKTRNNNKEEGRAGGRVAPGNKRLFSSCGKDEAQTLGMGVTSRRKRVICEGKRIWNINNDIEGGVAVCCSWWLVVGGAGGWWRKRRPRLDIRMGVQ